MRNSMKNYFKKTMNEEQGRKSSSPLSVVNTRDMDSNLLPWGERIMHPTKIIQGPDDFSHCICQPRYMKLKLYEVED
jgi:hypothetical protein